MAALKAPTTKEPMEEHRTAELQLPTGGELDEALISASVSAKPTQKKRCQVHQMC